MSPATRVANNRNNKPDKMRSQNSPGDFAKPDVRTTPKFQQQQFQNNRVTRGAGGIIIVSRPAKS